MPVRLDEFQKRIVDCVVLLPHTGAYVEPVGVSDAQSPWAVPEHIALAQAFG